MSEFPVGGPRESETPARASDFEYVERPPPMWEEEEESGFDLRRIFAAVMRRKWLVVLTTLLGVAGAAAAWLLVEPEYTAAGSLWVDVEDRSNPGVVSPIRQQGVFETTDYIELLRQGRVLLPVVQELALYLQVDPDQRPLLEGLEVEEQFLPGAYTLTVGEGGAWSLTHGQAGPVGSGASGEPMGADIGIRFVPELGDVAPETEVDFRLLPVNVAADQLGQDLVPTTPGREGNFIRVSYTGPDAERTTAIVNSVLERHVQVAGELKRSRLDETEQVLEEQLITAQNLLAQAETELENFRVRTVVLPTDQATPIAPGIEMTRGPVFDNFFEMQMDLEAVRRDRDRIMSILETLPDSAVPVASLEAIPAAARSRELEQVLSELVALRADLRLYRETYSDEYPPIQSVLSRIATISGDAVPRILTGLVQELDGQVIRLEEMVDNASTELSEIPVRTIQEASLRRQVDIQETLYNDLRSRVENTRLAARSSVPDVQILERAVVPFYPSKDPRLLFAGGSLLGGLMLGLLGAVLLDRMDKRVRYPTQVGKEMGLDILGTIPRVRKTSGRKKDDENHAAVLEAFRELRISISFAFGSAGPLTFAMTSPSAGEGKTFISVNLAVAFAELGRRTILIDGDTRRGDAHRMLGIERTPGLTDYLADRTSGEIIHETAHENLSFIPSGSRGSHTPELLASHRMAQFLGTLKRAYDVVIIDCPPLTGGGDALVLASLTGNMAVVLRSGSTERTLAAERVEALSRFPIRILGAILNDTDPSGLYGYYPTYLPSYLTEVEADEEAEGAGQLVLPGAGGSSGSDD